MPDISELKERAKKALETGDDSALLEVVKEINKVRNEIAKVQAEQALAEAEALAGTRETLAYQIHKAVKELRLDKELKSVKSWGFTYKADKANPIDLELVYKSVSLLIPEVKSIRVSAGAGKTKDKFGKGLTQVFNECATADEKASLVGKNNSQQWQVKTKVRDRAIAQGLITPIK